jgi:uncharacterized protein YukE
MNTKYLFNIILATLLFWSCANDTTDNQHDTAAGEQTETQAPNESEGPSESNSGNQAPEGTMMLDQAQAILNEGRQAEAAFQAFSDELNALPANIRDAHASEFEEMQQTIEGIMEKQSTIVEETQNSINTIFADKSKPNPQTEEIGDLKGMEHIEMIKQCKSHTADYSEILKEYKEKLASWK